MKDPDDFGGDELRENYEDCVALYEQQSAELSKLKAAVEALTRNFGPSPGAEDHPLNVAIAGIRKVLEEIKPVVFQPIKYMDLNEFREFGFLQELNRLFLHPLGMAMSIETDTPDPKVAVWDYRDDPDGVLFGKIDQEKVNRVQDLVNQKIPIRNGRLGYWIQPREATGL